MSLLLERLQGTGCAEEKIFLLGSLGMPSLASPLNSAVAVCWRACVTEVLELLLELLEFVLTQGQGAACCVDLDTQEGNALARPHHLFSN